MPTVFWSGSTRPNIRTPASNFCSARAPSPREAGGAAITCSASAPWGRLPAARCASRRCRTISPPRSSSTARPARRPAAVDRAGGVRDRHHAGGGARLFGQRGRARLPPCALRALQLLHAVRRSGLRARPLPAVVGHQPGYLPDHGPADELFVGRRQPPAVFPVPPASLLCDQRAIFRGE